MFVADKFVEGFLFGVKEYSVEHPKEDRNITEYRLPHHSPNVYTRIRGEWVIKTGEPARFLVHSWDNNYVWNGQ